MGLQDDGFLRRAKITIPAAQIATGGVSNYTPIFTEAGIDSSHAIWSEAQSNGGDLRLSSDVNGNTRLALDLISIDTAAKTLEMAIQPQSLSAITDNELYLWWDHVSTQSQPSRTDTHGQDNAYHSSHNGHWPINDDPSGTAPQMINRTATANYDGTTGGSMTSGDLVSAQIGDGWEFDGVDDDVSFPDDLDTPLQDSSVSLFGWVKISTGSTTAQVLFSRGLVGTGGIRYGLTVQMTTGGGVSLQRRVGNANVNALTEGVAPSQDVWYHIGATFNKSTGDGEIFKNGVSVGSVTGWDTADVAYLATRDEGWYSGALRRNGSNAWSEGVNDYISLWNRVLSSAEIETLYNNTNAPGTFATLGTAESVGGSSRRALSGLSGLSGITT